MILLDSNLVIYSVRPAYDRLHDFLRDKMLAISAITRIETLGFHGLADAERLALESLLSTCHVFPIRDDLIEAAIVLRRTWKLKTADALIAATALTNGLVLATHDRDFASIDSLSIIDPIAE